ncbi:hypothetical protein [Mesonia maritima]|uniref:Uncharacterized protein n=1 Tax=Mesonia maritima TaxID=1793873 RepID=A0ABU1K7M0_9FLAO|nr:hypothetical protein [Mesonia maritima]MDR6301296.1 hypothetical protein [Mesonia maritima]
MKTKFLIILAVIGLLIGCSKDESPFTENPENSIILENEESLNSSNITYSTTSQWELAANPSNPLDYVGAEHNQALESFRNNIYVTESLDDVYKVVEIHFNEKYPESGNFASVDFLEPVINEAMNDYENGFEDYIEQLEISSLQKSKLVEIFSIIDNYDGYNAESLINEIKNVENEMLRIPLEEKSVVLIAGSVSRFSMLYWDAQYPVTQGWKLRKWLTVTADVIGGVAGAVAGSSTVIGGIAGGIKGAGAASAAFDKAWDVLSK